ncbi:vesicle-mediated transport-related protein [Rhizoctonia solani AG-1 IA]|uniref:Vesicle-mediated transport-related protein n=1 Tax=Thanatephorus cucumeris (strain AG1-IA) TaxID=983506 RepID=L8X1W9_THACA|nr:vesicle-mediated transport-related protein [Rhizoctonia solani AG-1 IA]
MILGLSISTLFIYIRSIYRTIELLDGWTGPIITNELYFKSIIYIKDVLDGMPIVVAMYAINVFHPGLLLNNRIVVSEDTVVAKGAWCGCGVPTHTGELPVLAVDPVSPLGDGLSIGLERLEDSLEAVEALAVGTQGGPRPGRQDSLSSPIDTTYSSSPPAVRHSLDTPSPTQHSGSFGYLPYQPRSTSQLADSAMSNLRRSLTLQRTASVNSGQPDAKGSRENSPIHAPTPRRSGLSLEERLRANFSAGDGSVSPMARSSSAVETPDTPTPVQRLPVSADPAQIPLPASPIERDLLKPIELTEGPIDPASVHLPMSPPAQHTHIPSASLDNLIIPVPRNQILAPSPVAVHPLSPPPPEYPISQIQPENHEPMPVTNHAPTPKTPPRVQVPEVNETPHRPPNIIVDVSTPSSALATPSEFATAESRSDITVGSSGDSVDERALDIATDNLTVLETDTLVTPINSGLSRGRVSGTDHPPTIDPTDNSPNIEDAAQTGVAGEEDGDTKLRERLKVVEERFSDISTSFKRLQAEKVAADKLIKELSPLEGIADLDGLRAYLTNQKMKVEDPSPEMSLHLLEQEERLEEVREMHKMESTSQSDLIEKLRQQLTESEALLKVAESDTVSSKSIVLQHEAEIERLKRALKDEEEKRTKAITLLKTVRQKLTKAEKERDDVIREREKDKEDLSAARAEIERIKADAERAKSERERDIAGIRDRFERELKETKERYEKELSARKGQYELEAITTKAAHSKELSAKTTRIANLESTVSNLVNEKDSLFEQCQTRQAEAESAQSHLQTVQNQLNEMQFQLREAEDRNSLLTDELDELRNGSRLSTHSPTPGPEVARLLSEAEGKFEGRLSEMRAKLRAIEKERNEAEDDWNKTLADRSKEIEKLRFALRQAEDKWIESGRVGKGMDEKVASLEQNVKELQFQRDGWEQNRSALEGQLKQQTIESDHAEALERASSLETQFEESKSRETSLKMSNKTLRDELRKVQSSAALLERQRPGGVGGFWSGTNPGNQTGKNGNGVTSPTSPRPSSPTVSEAGATPTKQEEEVNLEYIRNVILQFLEHKEMRFRLTFHMLSIGDPSPAFTDQSINMYRAIYASPFRATSLVRPHIIPRSTVFARTIVSKYGLRYPINSEIEVFPAKRYTKDHEWISYDSETKIGTISITKYAQSQLGDVVFVELASKGTTVEIGGVFAASDIVSLRSLAAAPHSI